jgi:hypothetical protein
MLGGCKFEMVLIMDWHGEYKIVMAQVPVPDSQLNFDTIVAQLIGIIAAAHSLN